MGTKNLRGNLNVSDSLKISSNDVMSNFAPAYSKTATYVVGDLCTYQGKVYQCSTAVETAEDFDSNKWTGIDVSTLLSLAGGGKLYLHEINFGQETVGRTFTLTGSDGSTLNVTVKDYANSVNILTTKSTTIKENVTIPNLIVSADNTNAEVYFNGTSQFIPATTTFDTGNKRIQRKCTIIYFNNNIVYYGVYNRFIPYYSIIDDQITEL